MLNKQCRALPSQHAAILLGDRGDLLDQLHHLIMPAVAVGIGWVGYLARLVRAAMLEVLNEDYILNARSFGLPERWIVFRYALRVAIAPTRNLAATGRTWGPRSRSYRAPFIAAFHRLSVSATRLNIAPTTNRILAFAESRTPHSAPRVQVAPT